MCNFSTWFESDAQIETMGHINISRAIAFWCVHFLVNIKIKFWCRWWIFVAHRDNNYHDDGYILQIQNAEQCKVNKNLVQKRPFLHPPAQIPIISRVQITKRSLCRKKRWISFAMKHVAHYTNSLLSVSWLQWRHTHTRDLFFYQIKCSWTIKTIERERSLTN
jgi:hypothetical protein